MLHNNSTKGKNMNIPNKLTVLRIIMVPVMVLLSFINAPVTVFGIPLNNFLVCIVFIIASITDKLDGIIARKKNLVTDFGKFLDPIADKILVISALIILVEQGKLPGLIPIIVIFREFLVSGYRLIVVENNGKVIAANNLGKWKTATQMVAITMMLVDNFGFCDFMRGTIDTGAFWVFWNLVAAVLMIASVVLTLISGYSYMKDGNKYIKDK